MKTSGYILALRIIGLIGMACFIVILYASAAGGVQTTRYLYDGMDVLAEYACPPDTDTCTLSARYTHNIGIDDPLAMERDGRAYFYHKDALGSIVVLTDDKGGTAQRYRYESFGKVHSEPGDMIQPLAFTGREYDPETELYYYRARYYDVEIERFVSEDPIGFAGGDVSLYRYIRNNPVNLLDPLGFFDTDPSFTDTWVNLGSMEPIGPNFVEKGI
jgi:RHS repeat-associated protein